MNPTCIRTWQARTKQFLIAVALVVTPMSSYAQADPQARSENQPAPPFRIAGNIYYVGASDVTSFLIVNPAGDILLDGGFVETAPQIGANIEKLGFKPSEVKFLLNSHAHYDHAGGLAELKKRTGAKMVAMEGDATVLASGGHADFFFGDRLTFPPIKPDRVIHDGDTVTLGNVTMTAHLTAGHTRGCTTWTMTTQENGKPLQVVFIGSMSVLPGYRLTGKESYPGMAADYEKSFRALRSLPCDVFLGAHGSFFDLAGKRALLADDAGRNPFIDPAGYRAYVEGAEAAYQAELKRQRASDPPRDPANPRSAAGVMQVEQEWLEALQRHDAKTLDRILAPEWTDNDWQGRLLTRSDYLAYFARTPAPSVLAQQHFVETIVRFLANGDVAIVTGMVVTDATDASGAKAPRPSRFTDVFVWRDGRWQAVSAQETHLPEAK